MKHTNFSPTYSFFLLFHELLVCTEFCWLSSTEIIYFTSLLITLYFTRNIGAITKTYPNVIQSSEIEFRYEIDILKFDFAAIESKLI